MMRHVYLLRRLWNKPEDREAAIASLRKRLRPNPQIEAEIRFLENEAAQQRRQCLPPPTELEIEMGWARC